MVRRLIISSDFSDPSAAVLAGPTEDSLIGTSLRVSDASSPLAAVKMLGVKFRRALVIDHYFDPEQGWSTRRHSFQRVATPGADLA